MKRAVANLPLHGGKAPAWLFQRMARLGGAITMAIVDEYGPREMLRRLSDPWWFQAFACVLGFDWHSSGVTTVTCGALREAQRIYGDDLGIIVAGGKGKTSRQTPDEIASAAQRYGIAGGDRLIYASRMSAKVDSAAVQDGFQIYHHSFFMTRQGAWCVVQQGMNDRAGYARRYHWLGESVTDFVCEPHYAVEDLSPVAGPLPGSLPLLNMVASDAGDNRRGCADLARQKPDWLLGEIHRLTEGPTLFAPRHHAVLPVDVNLSRLEKTLILAHENHPKDFEALLGTRQVGPATVRSLSLLAEIIYNSPPSRRDPTETAQNKWATYSYAHGGKDGHPFPVDRTTYDKNIRILLDAVRKARVGETDKADALKRLSQVWEE
jgi:hypothetical protein